MDWFKCLFCVESLKDSELICAASCEHFIHEWCLATMRSMGERHCKICEKDIVVHSVFKEFDLGRAIQVAGIPLMIKMLDEIIKLMKFREAHTTELQKKFETVNQEYEHLAIEHRALKFEKREADMRLTKLEDEKQSEI